MRRSFHTSIAFAWTFAVAVCLMAGVEAIARLSPERRTDLVTLGAWDAVVCLGLAWALVRFHLPRGANLVDLGLRPTPVALSLVGLLLGLSLSAAVVPVQALVEWYWPLSEAELVARASLFRVASPLHLALLTAVAACLVPFSEELFFRGAVYAGLRSEQPAGVAATMSGLCFVIVHLNLRDWLPLLVVATVLSYLRARSGSLLPSLALHVAFNAVSITLVSSGMVPAYGRIELSWPWVALSWVVTTALVVAAHRIARNSSAVDVAREQEERG